MCPKAVVWSCELKLHFNSVTGVDKSLSVCTKCHCSGGSSRLSNWRKWTKHHHIGFLLFNNALVAWYFQSLVRPKTAGNWGKTCLACEHNYPRPSSWLGRCSLVPAVFLWSTFCRDTQTEACFNVSCVFMTASASSSSDLCIPTLQYGRGE